MAPDPFSDSGGKQSASPRAAVKGEADQRSRFSFRRWFTGDKIHQVTAVIHTVILFVAAATLWFAYETLSSAEKGTRYQNAVLIIDQSSDIADRFKNVGEEKLLDVLENRSTDKGAKREIEDILDRYQRLIFKATVLKENKLMPPEFWSAFLKDFCDNMYNRYPFVQGWWTQQKDREPYASLSPLYRELSHECPVSGPRVGGAR